MDNSIGNSDRITRTYIDSLLIETRYMDTADPCLDYELYGEKFASPIMTAALSHLDKFMAPGAEAALAKGAKEAGAVLWFGMASIEDLDRLADTGARMIEIIKPYAAREEIYTRIRHAEERGFLAVGIDIDHAFDREGNTCVVDGQEMKAMTTQEFGEICKSTKLPVIAKGILSIHDAEKCLNAGAGGLVLSHHMNCIEYAIPPLAALPEIAKFVNGAVPVFAENQILTGMDAFKALALGASGVCIGRPLMNAIKQDPENGVRDYLLKANQELRKAMAFTGTTDLSKMDPTVIRFVKSGSPWTF